MRCEEVRELLPDLLNGLSAEVPPAGGAKAEAPPQGRAKAGRDEVVRHLASCTGCSAELALLRAVAADAVPERGGEWAEGLPAAVLAEAARREGSLLARVAALPVPDPGAGWSASLPERVRESIDARRSFPWLPAPRAPLWWGGGIAAAAAALILFLQSSTSPLSQAADGEFVLAVNSSAIALGTAADLAGAAGESPDWLEGLEGVDLTGGEDDGGRFYRSPVPRDWDLPEEQSAPSGGEDALSSGAWSSPGSA